jgi:hypothetical protein
MSPSNSSKAAPDLRIQGDRITLVRSQVKEDSRSTDAGRDEILLNHMARFRTDPIGFVSYFPSYIFNFSLFAPLLSASINKSCLVFLLFPPSQIPLFFS